MASTLAMWEVDPLFPAAEEVQNSSERMEYIFRSWKHTQGIVQSAPDDKSLLAAAATDKRDLLTALDTVRWQLEDFAKAVKNVAKPEFISSRYSQFVRAIQSQVGNVEQELGELRSEKKSYARLEEEDSQCLAQFLSGNSRELEAAIDEASAEEASVAVDESDDAPTTSVSIPVANGHHPRNGFHHLENGDSHSKPNGVLIHNGVRDPDWSKPVNGDSHPKPNGLILNGVRDPEYSGIRSKLGKLWGTWRAKTHPLRLQVSNSVLKRWKDGEKCLSSLRNRFEEAGDLEQGLNIRKMNGSCSYSPPKGECSSSSSSRLTGIERRLQRAQQSFPSAFQISVAAIVVVVFMGLYFWFLSTLVPYDHAESFLH